MSQPVLDGVMGREETKARAMILVTQAVADSIRDAGPIPAGHLYAALMGVMSLDLFEQVVGGLVNGGLVRRDRSHLLTWAGPTKE
jgi:hypothetical protein